MLPKYVEDSKSPMMGDEKEERMFVRSPSRRNRPIAIAFVLVAALYFLWTPVIESDVVRHLCKGNTTNTKYTPVIQVQENKTLVPFEAHIMSKCPDAQVSL